MLYVDRAEIPYGRMRMSHLLADTTQELRQAARILGLKQEWIQRAGTEHEHFAVSMAKRDQAIRNLSAKAVTSRELVAVIQRKRRVLKTIASLRPR